jgi:hypothetical protein
MGYTETERPEDWDRDLNPDGHAGRNAGPEDAQAEKEAPAAADLKAVHRRYHWLTDEALGRIPILPEGTRLKQGATYIDLMAAEPTEFTALGDMEATRHHWYVPKREVDEDLWRLLLHGETRQ